jgi:hypothetical protein
MTGTKSKFRSKFRFRLDSVPATGRNFSRIFNLGYIMSGGTGTGTGRPVYACNGNESNLLFLHNLGWIGGDFCKKKGYVISDRGIAHTVLCLSLAVRIIHRPLQTQYFTHILGMARSKGHQTGTQRELRALFTLDTPIPPTLFCPATSTTLFTFYHRTGTVCPLSAQHLLVIIIWSYCP